jgi:hypothetical protein
MLLLQESCDIDPVERGCYDTINESSSKKYYQHDTKESRRAFLGVFLVWSSAAIVGSSLLISLGMWLVQRENQRISVAFVGNSFQFVNDLPRFLEALSLGNIHQDSMLHGSLSLVTFLQRGNGMHNKWNTTNAFIENGIFDYGACTVPQLLLGYDDDLTFRNENGYYKDDGMNPCFQDDEYYAYRQAHLSPSWNYVILQDQSARPAYQNKRNATMNRLRTSYSPMLVENGATPVLLMTYGYWRDSVDMTELVDVPTFTSLLYEGYREYAQLLKEELPDSQAPLMAPVGLAFLVVWEETYELWERLFFEDQLHPSPLGTYLMGSCLYATLYKRLPKREAYLSDSLWSRARRMQLYGDDLEAPTEYEAAYFQSIVQRVVLEGYIPKILVDMRQR